MKIDKVYIITLDQSDENRKSILERLVFKSSKTLSLESKLSLPNPGKGNKLSGMP